MKNILVEHNNDDNLKSLIKVSRRAIVQEISKKLKLFSKALDKEGILM